MAIEVTDEIRQAVYEADCERMGHLPNVSKMFASPNPGVPSTTVDILGPDDNTLPHISCNRCGYVWLVMPESAKNYDMALQNLRTQLSDPESIKPKKRKQAQDPAPPSSQDLG